MGGRRGLLATVTAFILAVAGVGVIAVAAASQQHAPKPPASAAGTLGPPIGHAHIAKHTGMRVVGPVLPRSTPMRIDIPAIDVHSPLLSLGIVDGAVEVPSGVTYNEAGWYRYSPTPGSVGPSVILGHIDSGAWGPSVFFKLGDLRPGDLVRIVRADGIVAVFRVDGVRLFPKANFPTKLVYGNTNFAALRLITCGGSFDWSIGHYVDNTIVFGSLLRSHPVRRPGN
jgi:hypothetical protein